MKQNLNKDILFFKGINEICYLKLNKPEFFDISEGPSNLKSAILKIFNPSRIIKIKFMMGFENMMPFGHHHVLMSNEYGEYYIVDIAAQSKLVNLKGEELQAKQNKSSSNLSKIQEFSLIKEDKNELISLAEFSKMNEFLILNTTKKDLIYRMLVFKVKYPSEDNEAELPIFQILHKYTFTQVELNAFKQPCYFSHMNCQSMLNNSYLLICYQRNYPYKRLVFTLNNLRLTELIGFSTHIGKWKNGFCVKKNSTYGTVLGNGVGKRGRGRSVWGVWGLW